MLDANEPLAAATLYPQRRRSISLTPLILPRGAAAVPLYLRTCELAGLAMPGAGLLPLAVAQQEAVAIMYMHRPSAAVPESTGDAEDGELSGVLRTSLLRLSMFYFWHGADAERGRWAVAHSFNLTNRLRAVPGAEPASTRKNYAAILSLFAVRQFNSRLGRSPSPLVLSLSLAILGGPALFCFRDALPLPSPPDPEVATQYL